MRKIEKFGKFLTEIFGRFLKEMFRTKGDFQRRFRICKFKLYFLSKSCHTHDIFYLCFKIFFCKNCDKCLKGKNDLTHKRLFRSQAEIKTDNPIWNSSSSCNECGETFDSKRKPKIPAEVPLKLKKGEESSGYMSSIWLLNSHWSWLDRMWPEEPVFWLKLLPHRKQEKRQKKKWRKIFGRSANPQTLGGIFA